MTNKDPIYKPAIKEGAVYGQPKPDLLSQGLLQKFGNGLTLGWRDELSAVLASGLSQVLPNPYSDTAQTPGYNELYERNLTNQRTISNEYQKEHPLASLAAETAGGVVTGIATAGTLNPAAGMTGNIIKAIGLGALEGGIYGAGDADNGDRQGGALTGATVGAIAGPVGYLGLNMASRILNKLPAPAANVQRAVQKGEKLGYKYTPAQQLDNATLQKVESGFINDPSAAGVILKNADNNQTITNTAAAKAIGERSTVVSDEVIDSATFRLNKEFEDLGGLKNIYINKGARKKIQNIADQYRGLPGQSKGYAILDDFAAEAQQNNITAKRYQELHSYFGEELADAKGQKKKALIKLRETLNDMVEKQLPKGSLKRWQAARKQWENLLLVTKSGVLDDSGNVSPAMLRNKIRQKNPLDYARGGGGELADVARAAKRANTYLGSSGTAERAAATARASSLLPPNPIPYLKALGYNKFPNMALQTGSGQNKGVALAPGIMAAMNEIADITSSD